MRCIGIGIEGSGGRRRVQYVLDRSWNRRPSALLEQSNTQYLNLKMMRVVNIFLSNGFQIFSVNTHDLCNNFFGLVKTCCFVLTNFTRWVETIKLANVSIMDYLMPPSRARIYEVLFVSNLGRYKIDMTESHQRRWLTSQDIFV